jgi:hypothetical protein
MRKVIFEGRGVFSIRLGFGGVVYTVTVRTVRYAAMLNAAPCSLVWRLDAPQTTNTREMTERDRPSAGHDCTAVGTARRAFGALSLMAFSSYIRYATRVSRYMTDQDGSSAQAHCAVLRTSPIVQGTQ